MSLLFPCLLAGIFGAEPAGDVRIDAVLVTLIEKVDVPAPEAGVLMRIAAKEGQIVEEGQLLGQIDDREVAIICARAEADLAQARRLAENDIKVRFARKSEEVAKAELKRSLTSVENFPKSVSQSELDRLRLVAEKATLEIEQAAEDLAVAQLQKSLKEHDLERATLQRDRRKIMAPLTGMVVEWKKHRGEWVEPGAVVVRVIRMHRLRAEGFAAAGGLPLSAVGQPVTFKTERPGQPPLTLSGELAFVSPEIDPVNGQVRFWAEIDNPQLQLRPGQAGTLTIHPRPAAAQR